MYSNASLRAGCWRGSDGTCPFSPGVCAALRRDDYVVSTHRGHGHCIAKGADVGRMLAELLGRATGYCRGRGGSMHLFAPDVGLLGGNGVVGAGIPIAVGAAYAAKYRGSERVVACFFGDGAANQGTFHESANMAALWGLPLILVCENNQYAATTRVSESLSVSDVAIRAAAYGMPGEVADGNDAFAVRAAALQAVERARAGGGPSLIECKTYRYEGHCMVLHDHRRQRPGPSRQAQASGCLSFQWVCQWARQLLSLSGLLRPPKLGFRLRGSRRGAQLRAPTRRRRSRSSRGASV